MTTARLRSSGSGSRVRWPHPDEFAGIADRVAVFELQGVVNA
ncbi:hypothetical protein [Pseudonocardia zijingensis]